MALCCSRNLVRTLAGKTLALWWASRMLHASPKALLLHHVAPPSQLRSKCRASVRRLLLRRCPDVSLPAATDGDPQSKEHQEYMVAHKNVPSHQVLPRDYPESKGKTRKKKPATRRWGKMRTPSRSVQENSEGKPGQRSTTAYGRLHVGLARPHLGSAEHLLRTTEGNYANRARADT